jgi:hypothetical protein
MIHPEPSMARREERRSGSDVEPHPEHLNQEPPAMKGIRYGTIALAFVASVDFLASADSAAAQGFPGAAGDAQSKAMSEPSHLKLSPAQRTAILAAVLQESGKVKPPPRFELAIGGQVPPSIELYMLPNGAMAQSPELRSLKYTMVQNQVVLVDPTNMRVIDILRQ